MECLNIYTITYFIFKQGHLSTPWHTKYTINAWNIRPPKYVIHIFYILILNKDISAHKYQPYKIYNYYYTIYTLKVVTSVSFKFLVTLTVYLKWIFHAVIIHIANRHCYVHTDTVYNSYFVYIICSHFISLCSDNLI